jgi:hypothetical protein
MEAVASVTIIPGTMPSTENDLMIEYCQELTGADERYATHQGKDMMPRQMYSENSKAAV